MFNIKAGYRFRCHDSISIHKLSIQFSIFLLLSVNIVTTKAIDISNIILQMVN